MKITFSFLILLSFAVSNLAMSQTSPSLKNCASAVRNATTYVVAGKAVVNGQYNAQEISQEKFIHKQKELDDFISSLSVEECMQGQRPHMYSCLNESTGDLILCRK